MGKIVNNSQARRPHRKTVRYHLDKGAAMAVRQ